MLITVRIKRLNGKRWRKVTMTATEYYAFTTPRKNKIVQLIDEKENIWRVGNYLVQPT